MRTLIVALALACAVPEAYGARLVLGPERPVGSHEWGVAQSMFMRPAIATDGDELLVVYPSGAVNQYPSLYASRFDRHGTRLNAEPIPVLLRSEAFAPSTYGTLRAVWAGGHYVVFFHANDWQGHAIRLTRDGTVVEHAVIDVPSSWSWEAFDVATDGDEIVLAGSSDQILRLGADLRVRETIAIPSPGYAWKLKRAIAFGGGRYAIVTMDAKEVTSRFLVDGVLTSPVRVGPANNEEGGPVRVVWTGKAFVAAWVEDSDDVYELGLGVWTALTAAGEAAGPLRALESIDDGGQCCVEGYGITVTPLDEETVFVSWEGYRGSTARGRRFRLSGEPVGGPVEIGTAPAAVGRTPQGALLVLDGALRGTAIESAAVTPLPDRLVLEPVVAMLPSEELLAAAATASEIAIVRATWRDGLLPFNDAAISVMAHDGSNVRDLRVTGRQAALATDGSEFFALLADGRGGLWFQRVNAPGERVRVSEGGAGEPRLAWNGSELVAMWIQGGRVWVTLLGRDGRRVADDAVFGTDAVPQLFARCGRLLAAWRDGGFANVAALDRAGRKIEPPASLPFRSEQVAMDTDGATDVYASLAENQKALAVAVRRAGGAFTVLSSALRHDGESLTSPAVAIAGGYLVAYGTWNGRGGSWTRIALLAEDGHLADAQILASGRWGPVVLVRAEPGAFVAVYTRMADELPYAGVTRTFTRTVTIEDDLPRRRAARR